MTRKIIGLFLGPALFLALVLLPSPPDMSDSARLCAAVAILMAVWWITEAIPIAATALLPLAMFPLMGITSSKDAAAPYANHLIFLFMGGFIIALSMQRWGLHKRIALGIIAMVGTSPRRIILGFMIAAAFLSMWISNTATTVMMVPIGMAVINHFRSEDEGRPGADRFAVCLMLGLAYSASIGGIGTLIGTPPNLVLANTLEKMYGKTLGFLDWLQVGLPLVVVMIPLTWVFLTYIIYPCRKGDVREDRQVIDREIQWLGRWHRGEIVTLAIFIATALCWICRSSKDVGGVTIPGLDRLFPMITDSAIAMFFALLLFLIPVNWRRGRFAMDWGEANKLPWGILILFGGGLSLANGFKVSGLAQWIGLRVKFFSGAHELILIVAVVTIIIFLTEMTSNTATTSMALPILGSIAVGLGESPMLLMAPAAIAASCAFMLPVATPPNAIIFASGHVTIPQMARAGLLLNVISIFLVSLFAYLVIIPLLVG